MVQAQQKLRPSGHYCFGNLVVCFAACSDDVNEIEEGLFIGCRGDELIEGVV
jgi:hypothetical protein